MAPGTRSWTRPAAGEALDRLMGMVRDEAGIQLGPTKRHMARARIDKRLRELGLGVGDYLERVCRDGAERDVLVDLMTTNYSQWWREPAHFVDLEQRLLSGAGPRPRLRIWSAACAGGEEPWSIALCALRALGPGGSGDVEILATDLSRRALARARAGTYPAEALEPLPADGRRLAVRRLPDHPEVVEVRPELRRLVHFARLNLLGDWPMRGPFDAIFCRNVMIYFDRPTQGRLVKRLAGLLRRGGTLYVGHSESLTGIDHGLRHHAPSVYILP